MNTQHSATKMLSSLLSLLLIITLHVGIVPRVEAAPNFSREADTLVNGSIYPLDPERTPERVAVSLGYLDGSGVLSGPIVDVCSYNINTSVIMPPVWQPYDNGIFAVFIDEASEKIHPEKDEESFQCDPSTLAADMVNVYYHIQKVREFLLMLGLDQNAVAENGDVVSPLADVVADAVVLPEYELSELPTLVGDEECHELLAIPLRPYAGENMYFFGAQARDALVIYRSFIAKCFEAVFLPEETFSFVGAEMLSGISLFLSYATASRMMNEDICTHFASYTDNPLHTLDASEIVTYMGYEENEYQYEAYVRNVVAVVGALWALREAIPVYDAERVVLMAALIHMRDSGIEALGDACIRADRSMFQGKYENEIKEAFSSRGLSTEIIPPNVAPIVTAVADQEIVVGNEKVCTVEAYDPDGDEVVISSVLLDGDVMACAGIDGMAIQLSPTVTDVGSHVVTVIVTDGEDESSVSFVLDVTMPASALTIDVVTPKADSRIAAEKISVAGVCQGNHACARIVVNDVDAVLHTSETVDEYGLIVYEYNFTVEEVSLVFDDAHTAAIDVVVYDATGEAIATDTITVYRDVSAPTVPAAIEAVMGATHISLSWDTATDDTGVAGYRLYRDDVEIVTISGTAYDDKDLVAATTYVYRASAFDAAGNESALSAAYTFTTRSDDGVLPPGWDTGDVGSVGVLGGAVFSDEVFVITGSGQDIWGTKDGFRYVYQTLNGNGEIVAHVNSVENTNTWAKAGVMIRDSLESNALHALIAVTPGNGVAFQRRRETGGSSYHTYGSRVAAPYWVKLVREGNLFSSYESVDGESWTPVGSAETIAMSQQVYVGLAVTSHANSVACAAKVSNVRIDTAIALDDTVAPTVPHAIVVDDVACDSVRVRWETSSDPETAESTASGVAGYRVYRNNKEIDTVSEAVYVDASVEADTEYVYTISAYDAVWNESAQSVATSVKTPSDPTILPDAWRNQDIGSVNTVGDAGYQENVFTLEGSGADIWGTRDGFQYAYQLLGERDEIVARVVSVENTNVWAKAGVMIRDSLEPDAAHVFMGITPGNGAVLQRRLSSGAGSLNTRGSSVTAPYWVKLVRTSNLITGFESLDGEIWTPVGEAVAIVSSEPLYVGLAVTSHDTSVLCSAVFDQVAVRNTPVVIDEEAPSVPTNVTANASDTTSVTINWTAATDDTAVTGYVVYRDDIIIGTTEETTYSDTGLTPGTDYAYAIAAYDAAGNESAVSTFVSATTTIDIHTYQLTLNSRYGFISTNPDGYAFTEGTTVTLTAEADDGYQFNEWGGDIQGTGNPTSVVMDADKLILATFIVATDTEPPSAPTHLAATATSVSSIDLSWTAATDNVAVTQYTVYRGGVVVDTTTTTDYTDTGLFADTQYSYTVVAEDAEGNTSSATIAVTITTPADIDPGDGGVTYYVSNTGSDANDGLSESTPWQTIAKVNSETFEPGDAILFSRGDTWREEMQITWSGTVDAPITIAAYGVGSKPRILGSTRAIDWVSEPGYPNIWRSGNTVNIPDSPGYGQHTASIFFGELDGSTTWGTMQNITNANVSGTNFSNLTAEYDWSWENNHIYVYANQNPSEKYSFIEVPQRDAAIRMLSHNPQEHIIIDGLEMMYQIKAGYDDGWPMDYEVSGLDILNCHIGYIGVRGAASAMGLQIWHSDMLVQNNDIHDCGRRNISYNVYVDSGRSNNNLMFENVVFDNNTLHNGYHTTGFDISHGTTANGVTYTDTFRNFVFKNNIVYDDPNDDPTNTPNDWTSMHLYLSAGAADFDDFKVHNNVFKYAKQNALIMTGVNGIEIYNNVFYGINDRAGGYRSYVSIGSGNENIDFYNNIIYGTVERSDFMARQFYIGSEADVFAGMNNNLYYQEDPTQRLSDNPFGSYNYTEWSQYVAETGWDLNSPEPQNPLFIDPVNNDFRIREGSPAIDAGAVIPGFNDAYNGDAPDIGVFESNYDAGEVIDTQAPSVPRNVVATETVETTVTLSWSVSTDDTGVTEYRVYRDSVAIATVTDAQYVDSGLTAETAYEYTIEAVDAAGNVSPQSSILTVVTAAVTEIYSLTLSSRYGSIATDSTGYEFVDGTEVQLTAEPDSGYQFESWGGDVSGTNNPMSLVMTADTLVVALFSVVEDIVDVEAPSVPEQLRTMAVTSQTISMAWNVASDNHAVVSYTLYRDGAAIANVAGVQYVDTGLSAGTVYEYTVSAVDAAGNESAVSDLLTVTTESNSTGGVTVTASSFHDSTGNNEPVVAYDGRFDAFWSSYGDGEWIQFAFDEPKELDSVSIAFFVGNQRNYYFTIQTSDDAVIWTDVFDGQSSGTMNGLESFFFDQVTASYVRIVGHMNSANAFNNYVEVDFPPLQSTLGSDVPSDRAMNILFLGNSFTAQGPVPNIVQYIATTASWPTPTVASNTPGGVRLSDHRENTDSLTLIDQGNWDYVVLQDHSYRAFDGAEAMKEDVAWLYDRVKAESPDATVVLYETWATTTVDEYTTTQAVISGAYEDAADYVRVNATASPSTDIVVAPVGDIWAENYTGENPINLHATDHHANPTGRYLNGLVIYSTIYTMNVTGVGRMDIPIDDALCLQKLVDGRIGVVVPDGDVPQVPMDFAATTDGTSVSLSWDEVNAIDISGYRVYRDNAFLVDTTESQYVDTGLVSGETYTYAVVAVDAAGNESEAARTFAFIGAQAESSMLSEVPLIHNQTFLIPENSVTGDTIGDVNLMWIAPSQIMQFELIDDDEGRFTVEQLNNRECVSNHELDYEVRIIVDNPDFDYDTNQVRTMLLRATNQETGEYSEAMITVNLSREEDTVFIDPDYVGGESDGSRERPFTSWMDDISGGFSAWSWGRNFLRPGMTLVQKRGTVYECNDNGEYMGFSTEVAGTEDQHIVIGAYGAGDRPVFESITNDTTRNIVGGGTGIRLRNADVEYYDFYSIAFAKQSVGIITDRYGYNNLTFNDLHFYDNYGVGIYFWVTERDDEIFFSQEDVDARYAQMADCYSERTGFVPEGSTDPMPNDNYGFKFAGAGKVDVSYTVVRFNENHGFSNAATTSSFRYCQSIGNRYGIKAHGDDIVIDHTLIKDNTAVGVLHGSYYDSYGLFTNRLRISDSHIDNNVMGLTISEDPKDGVIENTIFSNNSNRAVDMHYANPYAYEYTEGPSGFTFRGNTFRNNNRGFVMHRSPRVTDTTIINNVFYDNASVSVDIYEASGLEVLNNVFYNNGSTNDIEIDAYDGELAVKNNLLSGGIYAPDTVGSGIEYNFHYDDAYFVDASARDFRLAEDSVAIDAGIDVGLPYNGNAPDLGAFESVYEAEPGDTVAPTVPTNLIASEVSDTSVTITWGASTDNVGVAEYVVYRDSSEIVTVSDTIYVDTGLMAETAYEYTVAAVDAAGNESDISALLAVTTEPETIVVDEESPSVPEGLMGVPGETDVSLAWNASTDNVGVVGYRVYRDGEFVVEVAETAYVDGGLVVDTTYTYAVSAIDEAGNESVPSDSVDMLTCACEGTEVTLTLDARSDITDTFFDRNNPDQNYESTRYVSTFDRYAARISIPADVVGKTIVDAKLYVYAWNQQGYQAGQYLDLYYVTQSWNADRATWNNADIATPWTEVGGTRGALIGRSEHPAGGDHVYYPAIDITAAVSGWASGAIENNGMVLVNESSVSIGLKAMEYSRHTYVEITYIDDGEPAVDTSAPSIPSGVAASSVTASQVVVGWNASTDNVGVVGYQVVRNGLAIATTLTPGFVDSTVAAETEYTYTIGAFDAMGNMSVSSVPVSVTTLSEDAGTDYYTLSIAAENGAVTRTPEQEQYESGTVVTCTATPNEGYQFVGWQGDVLSTDNPMPVTITDNTTVVAVFEVVVPESFILTTIAENGTVTRDPEQETYDEGTEVSLLATADEGYRFVSWGGAVGGNAVDTTVVMDAAKTVYAYFEEENAVPTEAIIADHTRTNINLLPEAAVQQAKDTLYIAYGHTSHGSQITNGMSGLVNFMNVKGTYSQDLFAWNDYGSNGALHLDDYAMSGDLGNPNRTEWANRTRTYLNANPACNVIMWSWCGQASSASEADINTYLSLMTQLEADYPSVTFVYMTGHADGSGESGNLHQRNQQIRRYCEENDKVLFDFYDIECYDPDGVYYGDRDVRDDCRYDGGNWATEWQNSHTEGVDWYQCGSAHSEPLNANRKAYAAWYMFARIAGWGETV